MKWTLPPHDDANGNALILHVDVHEPSHTEVSALLRASYHVVPAKSDREACDLLRAHASRFVAIILDVELPGAILDGILLRRILRGSVPTQALPSYARDLPKLMVPILLATDRPDHYRTTNVAPDRIIARPLTLEKVTLAIVDATLERTLSRSML